MKKITFILFLLFTLNLLFAQEVRVNEISKLEIDQIEKGFYPKFINNDSEILITNSNYKGLYSFNISTKELTSISDKNGAGYNPLILEDDVILYRTHKFIAGKKYQSLTYYNSITNEKERVESDIRLLKVPKQLPSSEIALVKNQEAVQKRLGFQELSKLNQNSLAVYVEDNNLILVKNGKKKYLNPLGKGVYVWESISSNRDKVIFTFGNKGSFVCDLEGNILENIKEAHFPRFSPDGKYISYMVDKDNGHIYISSDIFVYSTISKKSYKITQTENIIEMFPEWSNDGNKLIFNTTLGDIYVASLQYVN
jgi:hypothetical protein